MTSLSAAAPFQDVTESNWAKIPSLNDAVSDFNEFVDYSDLTGVSSDAPEVLAFNSGLDLESNPKIDSGISESSNSNRDNAMYDLNNPGSSINLEEPISSVPLTSVPLVLAPDLGIPEVDSNIVETPVTIDPEISTDNPLIIAQDTGSMCAVRGTKKYTTEPMDRCPNPEYYIRPPRNAQSKDGINYTPRQVENNNAVKEKDGQYIDNHPDMRWDVDFDKICARYRNLFPRYLPLCCFGPQTAFFGWAALYAKITNEGNCVTYFPERPRCHDIDDRFCCGGMGKIMRWGWEGINCVPAQ
ncbi:hypothetical protein MMC29_004558 [Sticta canariensis]|nr:hypothetical protein [Sticta canariensis]